MTTPGAGAGAGTGAGAGGAMAASLAVFDKDLIIYCHLPPHEYRAGAGPAGARKSAAGRARAAHGGHWLPSRSRSHEASDFDQGLPPSFPYPPLPAGNENADEKVPAPVTNQKSTTKVSKVISDVY